MESKRTTTCPPRRWRRPCLAAAAVLVALGMGTGCKPDDDRAKTPLAVFAASSLTEAFEALEDGFETAHPHVDVTLTFAGSQILRFQIEQGAPADVFASANPEHMVALVETGTVDRSEVFAHNDLVVIVPVDAPATLQSFDDLPRATRIVLGTPDVPVGRYTEHVLDTAASQLGDDFSRDVRAHVVSRESNVRLVRAKVEMGEADAAIVYRTDAVVSDRVRIIEIPEALNVRADYHIGHVDRAVRSGPAVRFIDYVGSAEGRATLTEWGFSAE